MAIYAFDGTGNEDNPGAEEDTNVLKIFQAYNKSYSGPGKNFYVEGVGTRFSIIGKIFGSLFGAGGEQRIDEAFDCLEDNIDKGDREIVIVGFSRGAAIALEFANDIFDHGVNDDEAPKIDFLGIWDTVASFGIPGNNVNLGYTLTLPNNVVHCSHAIALDERRQGFPLTRVSQDKYSDIDQISINETWFRGFHSDVGGGNKNEALSSISLVWMFHEAKRRDIKLDDSDLATQKALRDPDAPCCKPGMDVIPNRKRAIRPDDTVHDSVSRRDKVARRFEANNPPKGLSVVNDDGEILGTGFNE
jgi:uncharacterized protein (DUF2235 family)